MNQLIYILAEVTARSSVILLLLFALLTLFRRRSAAERHFIILCALLLIAILPVGIVFCPKLSWSIPQAKPIAAATILAKSGFKMDSAFPTSMPLSVEHLQVQHPETSWHFQNLINGLLLVVAAGMLVQLGLTCRSWISLRKIRRAACPLVLPGSLSEELKRFLGQTPCPTVLQADVSVPLLVGWINPVILLPASSRKWGQKQLTMILLHECAHLRRADSFWLPFLCAIRIFYWWHPVVRLALNRIHMEMETACDNMVLDLDFRATDYAELIVEIARGFLWKPALLDLSLTMANPSHLETRIESILNAKLNRKSGNWATYASVFLLSVAIGSILIATEVKAQESQPTALPGATHKYPWKTNIQTTVFWIGEGANHDVKNPGNPFYVALPFNDLTHPDKAAKWVPEWWKQASKPGQPPISACLNRWIEIKSSDGHACYAQWEDVGPLRDDHAEYVFGDERPKTYNKLGLDISPAVANYLGLQDKMITRGVPDLENIPTVGSLFKTTTYKEFTTSWRFVDAQDVPAGKWLKYAEENVLLTILNIQPVSVEPRSDSSSVKKQEEYLQAWTKIQDASDLKDSDRVKATALYEEAREILLKIQKDDPTWETTIVATDILTCENQIQNKSDSSQVKTNLNDPQTQYLKAWLKFEEGLTSEAKHDLPAEKQDFEEAKQGWSMIQRDHPDWESALVTARIRDCQQKLSELP